MLQHAEDNQSMKLPRKAHGDLNTTAVDDCLNRLSTAIEKFKKCPTSDIYGLGA